MRLLSALTMVAVLAVFMLPSVALYAALNDTPWDDIVDVCPEVLIPALLIGLVLSIGSSGLLSPETNEITHPVSTRARRLFELDCALIC